MSASYLVNGINEATYPIGGIRTAGAVSEISEGGDGVQHFGFQHVHTTQGGWFETLGGAGTTPGIVANRHYTSISVFRAGRSYSQWALVQSPLTGLAYTKTTAGTQPLFTDPSTDALNWAANTAGAAVFNGSQIVDTTVVLQGNQPSYLALVSDAVGPAVTIFGRSADGTTNPRAQLGVQGNMVSSGLVIQNTYRPVGNTVIGSITLDPATGTGTIASTAINASSTILVTRTAAVSPGSYTVTAGVGSASVTSTSATDGSTLAYIVINPAN